MLSQNHIMVILNILKLNYIYHITVYHCENNNNSIQIQKMLNEKLFVNYHHISKEFDSYLADSSSGFIVDSNCDDWYKVFSNVTFEIPNTWIIVGSNITNIVHNLSQYPIEINSNVIILVQNESVYNLYEIFNTGYTTHGKAIVNYLGFFDTNLHITRESRLKVFLEGVTLKCPIVVTDAVVNETYLHFIDKWRPPARDPVHKFKFYIILRYLETMYGFKYDFIRTNSWGYLRNGSFDGMVGEMQKHNGDLGGSGVFFRADRAKYVQYAVEIWKLRPCFIFRHPKYPGGVYTVFTRPLSITVWGCLVAVLLLAGLLMSVMLRAKSETVDDSSLSLILVFITSAVGQQGIPIYSKCTSIKIVIFSTLIFSLTLYQYYNATVVSTLLREPPTTIRSLEDLLHSKMDVGIEDTLYDRDYFRRTTDPVAIKLYHTKIVTNKRSNIFSAEVGMSLVKRGGFALHLESVAGYRIMRATFTEREVCEVQEMQLYPPQQVGVVLKKDSPYREHFAVGIRKMHEVGLMTRLNSLWEESKPPCVRTPDTSVISVSITDFCMALVVLSVGMVMALVALFFEIVLFKIYNR